MDCKRGEQVTGGARKVMLPVGVLFTLFPSRTWCVDRRRWVHGGNQCHEEAGRALYSSGQLWKA